jgi:hypothetical protein
MNALLGGKCDPGFLGSFVEDSRGPLPGERKESRVGLQVLRKLVPKQQRRELQFLGGSLAVLLRARDQEAVFDPAGSQGKGFAHSKAVFVNHPKKETVSRRLRSFEQGGDLGQI